VFLPKPTCDEFLPEEEPKPKPKFDWRKVQEEKFNTKKVPPEMYLSQDDQGEFSFWR
jgi:hypothetical protein